MALRKTWSHSKSSAAFVASSVLLTEGYEIHSANHMYDTERTVTISYMG